MAHRKAYLWFQIKAISFPTNSHFRSWKWCLLNEESRIKRSWEVAPCDQRVKQSMILNQRNVNGEWSHNETSKELNRQLLDSFWYPKIRKETAPSQRFSLETMAQGPLGNVWRYWSCQNLGWEWRGGSMSLAFSGQRSGMLLNTLQCIGTGTVPPATTKNVNGVKCQVRGLFKLSG